MNTQYLVSSLKCLLRLGLSFESEQTSSWSLKLPALEVLFARIDLFAPVTFQMSNSTIGEFPQNFEDANLRKK